MINNQKQVVIVLFDMQVKLQSRKKHVYQHISA